MAWDVADVESAGIAADLVQRSCLMERYRRPSGFGRHQCQQQPLILCTATIRYAAAYVVDTGHFSLSRWRELTEPRE